MSKPFRIKKSVDNQYYFTIVGRNGAVLATSETVKQKESAKKGIRAILIIFFDSTGVVIPEDFNYNDLIQDETLKHAKSR